MQSDLFGFSAKTAERLPLPDSDIRYLPQFLPDAIADQMFSQLLTTLAWRQDHIRMYGKAVKIPRLQAWYGEPEAAYTYSGLTLSPLPWTAELTDIRQRCEQECEVSFNAVLANLYRDGNDSMGWHADDEPELGPRPTIASVSLGQSRDFDFKHKQTGERFRLSLEHGSLLIMAGDTQQHWLHGIYKRRTSLGQRVNLTFRTIYPLEKLL